jgi:hypothetical protein
MTEGTIIVTDADMDRLTRIVRAFKHSLFRDQQQLDLLEQVLSEAEVRPSTRVPKDVIRMNSRVRVFDFETRTRDYTRWHFPKRPTFRKGCFQSLLRSGLRCLGEGGET